MESLFPYFGGKSAIASAVWRYLGHPDVYVEPFFGSGAVMFSARNWEHRHEIICDKDPHICNVWRSIKLKPEIVAEWADWPVTHADLTARKIHLNARTEALRKCLEDPEWCDPICAGYWIWACGCWIGSGMTCPNQRPHVGNSGMGVHRKSLAGQRPHVGNSGMGVHRKSLAGQIPHVGNVGMGVHKKSLGDCAGDGLLPRTELVWDLIRQYSRRLRRVKEVTGDWSRVCGGEWRERMGVAGMFFDPPYGEAATRVEVYAEDSMTVADDVRAWCLEHGTNPLTRIVLAGYYEEHECLLARGWTVERWRAQGGYGNVGSGQGKENRHREALFVSPHCVGKEAELFD